jgi:acetyl-CoA C-acetyltransferase
MGIYIKGAGMTKFDVDNRVSQERIFECVLEALDSSEMNFDEIETIFVANCELETNDERQRHVASMISSLFQKKMPIIALPAGCGSGAAALWNAIEFQKKNRTKNILVIGFEKLVANISEKVTDEMFMGGERIYEQTEGMIFPAQNALVAQQYMAKYDCNTDDLALVALKNHENAFLNPKARFYNKKISLDMIKKSPIVASPLRLFDCSLPSNGAAALILSTDKSTVEVVGSGLSTSNLSSFERDDMTSWDSTKKSAKIAYEQSGTSPSDIDLVELHDAFTSVEIISYEDLGFCNKGEGSKLIREGITNLNGTLPVNTSGGLKAKGHPISATGISQVYEQFLQLTGNAGKRQVDNIKFGLTHNIGGAGSITGVHILKKSM